MNFVSLCMQLGLKFICMKSIDIYNSILISPLSKRFLPKCQYHICMYKEVPQRNNVYITIHNPNTAYTHCFCARVAFWLNKLPQIPLIMNHIHVCLPSNRKNMRKFHFLFDETIWLEFLADDVRNLGQFWIRVFFSDKCSLKLDLTKLEKIFSENSRFVCMLIKKFFMFRQKRQFRTSKCVCVLSLTFLCRQHTDFCYLSE